MTVYYCDEWHDDSETREYMAMTDKSPSVITFDITNEAKAYNYAVGSLSILNTELDLLLPSLIGMLSCKGEGDLDHQAFIQELRDSFKPAPSSPNYFAELAKYSGISYVELPPVYESELFNGVDESIDLFAHASGLLLKFLGEQVKSAGMYKNKLLAYSLYSFENGFLTFVVNNVPVSNTKHRNKIAELLYRKSHQRLEEQV